MVQGGLGHKTGIQKTCHLNFCIFHRYMVSLAASHLTSMVLNITISKMGRVVMYTFMATEEASGLGCFTSGRLLVLSFVVLVRLFFILWISGGLSSSKKNVQSLLIGVLCGTR